MPAYYLSSLVGLINDDLDRIVGALTTENANTGFLNLKRTQTKAWRKQVRNLVRTSHLLIGRLVGAGTWTILLEYPIPRRQKRIDAVLLARDVIFCIEFKTKAKTRNLQAQKQAEDYALDLRDFHSMSLGRRIVPIAVSSDAPSSLDERVGFFPDLIQPARLTNAQDLASAIEDAYRSLSDPTERPIAAKAWNESAYRPVPTIIEAAEVLYAGHDVSEIAHHHAGNKNLEATSQRIIALVKRAQKRHERIACFVTGIPGAGKTLAGLNVVHNPALRAGGRTPGVFLSGNGPLVKVIRSALERDHLRRGQAGDPKRHTKTFIQNVHEFVRVERKRRKGPHENVIVFDEAQRAWTSEKNLEKNHDKLSEPERILSIMTRHPWAVVVALVGGGQEIHKGEAGLAEWGNALSRKFSHWQVAVSPEAISGGTSVAGHSLFKETKPRSVICRDSSLHLDTTRRSFRAQKLTEWVEAVLNGDAASAAKIKKKLTKFPLELTRSLEVARNWLRANTLGLRRCGLVASSGGLRLRAEGLELSSGFRRQNELYVNWFLNDPTDVRSSNQLEVAASEFDCQGLELDWVGLCWSGDLTFDPQTGGWVKRAFRGNSWNDVPDELDQQYLVNKYRVLLTRAREGMIVWVPKGDPIDSTRPTDWFNTTFDFLVSCGLSTP